MASDYYNILDNVLGLLNQLESYSALHLTSIAKAIELNNPKINKIIFYELSGKGLNINGPGLLLNQELEMVGYDNQELVTYDHFIFYETHKLDSLTIRFAVAHELGHIFLHNPMEKAKGERVHIPVPGNEHLFAVTYNPNHEIEADLFALIMCEQRQAVKRYPFTYPCPKFIQGCISKGIISDPFKAITRKLKNCMEYSKKK